MAVQNQGDVYNPARSEGLLDKEVLQETVSQARDRLGAMYERGKARAQEWEGNFESMVSERPLRSVLIAAGVGLLLGALLSRR